MKNTHLRLVEQPEETGQSPDTLREYQKEIDALANTCRNLICNIQTTLLELEILLNGDLSSLLVHEKDTETKGERRDITNKDRRTKMANLKSLIEDDASEHDQTPDQEPKRYISDILIIRSRISGALRTIAINFLSGYKEAVDELIGNLNHLLEEFNQVRNELMDTYTEQLTKISRINLSQDARIGNPSFPKDIKTLPSKVNPACITPEILEANLHRYYGISKSTSSDRQPQA